MRARVILKAVVSVAFILLSALAFAVAATPSPASSPAQDSPGMAASAADVSPSQPLKAFFTGTISIMSDAGWTIETSGGSVEFSLREDSRIVQELGPAEIGATVRVLAHVLPDGTSVALAVVVKDPCCGSENPSQMSS